MLRTAKISSFRPRGMILKPCDIFVTRAAKLVIDLSVVIDWRLCSWVNPFLDFRMTVRKGKPASARMIDSRQVEKAVTDLTRSGLRIPVHFCEEVANVNAVLAHVQQNE